MWKKIKRKLTVWFAPYLMYFFMRLIYASLRKEYLGCEKFRQDWNADKRLILALWHNREVMAAPFYLHVGKKPIALLSSRSFDGLLAARVFKLFGAEVAWGSSTRDGMEGLKQMIDFGLKGYSLAITPDGPVGPVYKAKSGTVRTAQKTGLPIYTWGWGSEKITRLKTWDNWMVPHPFSRAVIMCGDPIHVPADADKAIIKAKCRELENELNRISRVTEEYFRK